MNDTFEPFDWDDDASTGKGTEVVALATNKKKNAKKTPEIKSDADSSSIIAAAQAVAVKNSNKRRKKAASSSKIAPKTAAKKNVVKKTPAKKTPAKKAPTKAKKAAAGNDVKKGFVTRGIQGAMETLDAGVEGRAWSLCTVAFAIVLISLSAASWHLPLDRLPIEQIRISSTDEDVIPSALRRKMIRTLPLDNPQSAFQHPEERLIDVVHDHLAEFPGVKSVDFVMLRDVANEAGDVIACLDCQIEIHDAVLPLVLENGSRCAVAADGTVLPQELEAPMHVPTLRQYEAGGLAALEEVLDFWPRLEREINPELIDSIYLHSPLDRRNQRGIVLTLKSGARVLWGAPGEQRYGVSAKTKIEHLKREIEGNGSLDEGVTINVRFSEAFSLVAKNSS